jgi:hypothetical protein
MEPSDGRSGRRNAPPAGHSPYPPRVRASPHREWLGRTQSASRSPPAVAQAALDGLLDGAALRALDPAEAIQRVQQVKGLGPFADELVVVRGANAPDALPRHERRLDAEITERYGPGLPRA